MTASQIVQLIKDGQFSILINTVDTYCFVKDVEKVLKQYKQYEASKHDVNDPILRKDKRIMKEPDPANPKAEPTIKEIVPVNRLFLPIQEDIVKKAAAFLGNPTIQAAANGAQEETLLALIKKTWKDNKLDYRFKDIVKTALSERESAELWYQERVLPDYYQGIPTSAKFRERMRVLSKSRGDTLYPVKDLTEKMIAFGRKFKATSMTELYILKEWEYFELYTEEFFYYFIRENNGEWKLDETRESGSKVINPTKKIPIIYYCREKFEWQDIQPLADRLETKASNHADTNDYYDSPIVFAEGDVQGFANKGESGKVLEGEKGSKVSYLTWDSSPESMKLEFENLQRWIHKYSQTPDISFDSMKGLTQFSGIALKMLFLDAHLKAADNEQTFGEGVQRRLNYLQAAFIVQDVNLKPAAKLEMEPKFVYFLPKNELEEIDAINRSITGGTMSIETGVGLNPLISDPESELARLQGEREARDKAEVDKAKAMQPPSVPPVA